MQEDWMTSKSKKMGEMVKVAPYIEQGEYKKYLITYEQDVCETRQFGFYACQECEHAIIGEPLSWHKMYFCSWKCLKTYMDAREEQ